MDPETRVCITLEQICNGVDDCPSGTDELRCSAGNLSLLLFLKRFSPPCLCPWLTCPTIPSKILPHLSCCINTSVVCHCMTFVMVGLTADELWCFTILSFGHFAWQILKIEHLNISFFHIYLTLTFRWGVLVR